MKPFSSVRLRRLETYVVIIICLALGLRAFHLTYRGLRLDEVKTLTRAELLPVELVYQGLQGGHLPLYFIAVRTWTAVFGRTEVALRSLSLAFGLLGLIWFWRLARLLASESAALLALVLFSANQINVWAAQEARMYAMLIFLSVGTSYYLVAYLSRGRQSDAAKFFIFSLCGLFTHLSYILLLLAQAGALLAIRRRTPLARFKTLTVRIVASCMLWLLAFVPLMLLQKSVSLRHDVRMPDIKRVIEQIVVTSWGDYDYLLGSSASYVLFLLIIGLWYSVVRAVKDAPLVFAEKQSPADKDCSFNAQAAFAVLLAWFFVPFIVLLILSPFSGKFLAATRYSVIALPASSVVFAIGLSAIRRPMVRALLAGIIVAFLLAITVCYQYSKGDQFREAIQFVSRHYEDGDVVFVSSGGTNQEAFRYYTHNKIEALAVPTEITDERKLPEMILEPLRGKRRVWVFLYHEKGPSLPMILEHDLASEFTPADTWRLGRVEVFLYERIK